MPVQRFFLSIEFSFGPGAGKELIRLVQAEDRVIMITDAGLVKAGVGATFWKACLLAAGNKGIYLLNKPK